MTPERAKLHADQDRADRELRRARAREAVATRPPPWLNPGPDAPPGAVLEPDVEQRLTAARLARYAIDGGRDVSLALAGERTRALLAELGAAGARPRVPAAEGRAARLVKGSKSLTPALEPEAALRLERRGWSGQYRLRLDYNQGPGANPPPINCGARATVRLSGRGKRAIADSAAYVLAKRGGFTTFLTLTFTPEQRRALEDGTTTVQRETSRFVNSASAMRRRGWIAPYKRAPKATTEEGWEYTPLDWNQATPRGPGRGWRQDGTRELVAEIVTTDPATGKARRRRIWRDRDPLDLLWIAEAPPNENGEENPHVHVLMRWAVDWELFPAWAHRLERRIWRNGFAHLERLRKPEAAGYYVAKAAGYLTKAASGPDQGRILGNRYGITRSARAPGWRTVAVTAADAFPDLFPELLEHAERQRAPLIRRRAHYRARLETLPKGKRTRAQRDKLRRALARTRAELAGLGFYMTRAGVVLTGWRKVRQLVGWLERRAWRIRHRKKPIPWDLAQELNRAAARRAERDEHHHAWRAYAA